MDLLRQLRERQGRNLPRSTAVDFVPPKWRSYVIDDQGRIDRAYFELCVAASAKADGYCASPARDPTTSKR